MTSSPAATLDPERSGGPFCCRRRSSPAAPAALASHQPASGGGRLCRRRRRSSTRRRLTGRPQALPEVGWAEHRGFAGDLSDGETNRELAAFAAETGPMGVVVNAVGISPKRNGARSASSNSATTSGTRHGGQCRGTVLPHARGLQVHAHGRLASIVNLLSITAKTGNRRKPGRGFRPVPAKHGSLWGIEGGPAEPDCQPCPRASRFQYSGQRRGPGIRADAHDGRCSAGRQAPRPGPHEAFRQPEEIADAVAFLMGNQSTYITGISLDVNGGWLTC